MNAAEALKLCRLAKALSPSQAVDQFTPEAWALVLKSVRYKDAELALEQLGGEQEYVHVSHIKQRVKRIRQRRIEDVEMPPPPAELSPREAIAWSRNWERRVGNGEHVETTTPEFAPRPNRAQLPQAGRTVREGLADPIRSARQAIADGRAKWTEANPEPEPLLGPDDHSREATQPTRMTTTTDDTEETAS